MNDASCDSNRVRKRWCPIGATSVTAARECARRKAELVGFLSGSDGAEQQVLATGPGVMLLAAALVVTRY